VERRAVPRGHRGGPGGKRPRPRLLAVAQVAGRAGAVDHCGNAGRQRPGHPHGAAVLLPRRLRPGGRLHPARRRAARGCRPPVVRPRAPRAGGPLHHRGGVCRCGGHRGRVRPRPEDRRVGHTAAGQRRPRPRGELLRGGVDRLARDPGRLHLPPLDRRAAGAGPLACRRRPLGPARLDPHRRSRRLGPRHPPPPRARGLRPRTGTTLADGRRRGAAAVRPGDPHPGRPGVDRAAAAGRDRVVGRAGRPGSGVVGGPPPRPGVRQQTAPRPAAPRPAALAPLRRPPRHRDRRRHGSADRAVVPGRPERLRPRHRHPAGVVPPDQVRQHALPARAQHLRSHPPLLADRPRRARHPGGRHGRGVAAAARTARAAALACPGPARGEPRQQAGVLQPVLARRCARRGVPGDTPRGRARREWGARPCVGRGRPSRSSGPARQAARDRTGWLSSVPRCRSRRGPSRCATPGRGGSRRAPSATTSAPAC